MAIFGQALVRTIAVDHLPVVSVHRRAWRRWKRQRRRTWLVARARNWGMSDEQALNYARLRVDTRQPCSCYMCHNRRKYEGATRQERLADKQTRQMLDEWADEEYLNRLPLAQAVALLDTIPHGPACLCDDCLRWADVVWANCEVETLVF